MWGGGGGWSSKRTAEKIDKVQERLKYLSRYLSVEITFHDH